MIGVYTTSGVAGGVAFVRGEVNQPITDRVEWPDVLAPFLTDRSWISI